MPSSVGLFSKAIMQSFPVGLPFRNSKDAPSFTKFVAKSHFDKQNKSPSK